MPAPLRVDWEDSLEDIENISRWFPRDARRVLERVELMASLGWSPGRLTSLPGVRYLAVPPLGVLYEAGDGYLHVLAVVDPRHPGLP